MRKEPERRINKGWIVLLVIALVTAAAGLAGLLMRAPDPGVAAPENAMRPLPSAMTQQEMQDKMERISSKNDVEPQEDVEQVIESYRERIEADPNDEERPALYQAMGNLYRQKLLDYEKAAWSYQQIILEHPDWNGIPRIYVNLATCYEKMDDYENTRRIYMEMMRVLPDDSQEYLYAKEKLGL